MMKQTTNSVLMIRPVKVQSNEQTIESNFFQQDIPDASNLQFKALREFDLFVSKLKEAGITVIDIDDDSKSKSPDAHFPNNWISFHENGVVGIYPLLAENRRGERREDILDIIESKGYEIQNLIDYSSAEEEEYYLEGTGSIVLDRVNRLAYCCISPRSDEELFIEFCEDFEYTPVVFTANQTVNNERLPIYHTNVMMSICEDIVIVCLQSIDDKKERKNVVQHLKSGNQEIINITEKQMKYFLGNSIGLKGSDEKNILVMSTTAFNCLTESQIEIIEKYNTIIHSDLETIEHCGGGSIRCMIAEVFLKKIE